MEHSESIGQLAAAKAKAQAEFAPVKKDMTANAGKYSYHYADLAACLAAVMPALTKYNLALFQPVSTSETAVICTTILAHESGEWISERFGVPVVDLQDAQSIGSAATYAKRYGLQGMLGFAPEEEDDDGQAARGGDHEMAKSNKACPSCGSVGTIIKSKPEFGGGWVCWRSKGGCETKWPEGPFPTSAPLEDVMPKRKEKTSAPEQATLGGSGASSSPQREVTTGAEPQSEGAGIGSPAGTEPSTVNPQKRAGGRAVKAAEPSAPKGTTGTFNAQSGKPEIAEGQVLFVVGPTGYVTNGLTEAQFMESVKLVPHVDRAIKKGASKELLMAMFGVPTRLELTAAQGDEFLKALADKMPKADEQDV